MASLRKCVGSQYWYGVFRDSAGKLWNRSTKISYAGVGNSPRERGMDAAEKRRKALFIAGQYEESARGHQTEAQVQKVLFDIYSRVNRKRIEPAIVETFFKTWLGKVRTRRGEGRTVERYEGITKRFLDSLGERRTAQLKDIAPADVQQFVDRLQAQGKAPATIRIEFKVISSIFADALKQGMNATNPAAGIAVPLDAGETRRPFSWAQVQSLIAAVDDQINEAETAQAAAEAREMKTLLMLGAFTGARLGDCCTMRWENIDLPGRLIRFRPSKTKARGHELVIPLHECLESYLLSLGAPEGDGSEKQPLCPILSQIKVGGRSGLSRKFLQLIARAGIENEQKREGKGAGRSMAAFSFHSLRHTFNSALLNNGVGEDLRMRLSGHASAEMNRRYSHAEIETLRAAVSKLPGIPA